MTPYPGPSQPYGYRVRCLLATLVLTVLTLVGGGASASAAASAPTYPSLAPAAVAAQTPAAPQTNSAGQGTGRDSRHHSGHGTGHDFRPRAGHATGPGRGGSARAVGPTRPRARWRGPDTSSPGRRPIRRRHPGLAPAGRTCSFTRPRHRTTR